MNPASQLEQNFRSIYKTGLLTVLILIGQAVSCPQNCRCIDDNTKVICMNIQTLSTADLPLTTQKFILTGNHMVEFPVYAFRHLKQLRSLGLTFNQLTFIPTNLSSYFPNLKEYFLTGNEIELIRPLHGLESITVLNLDNNRIRKITPGSFRRLKNLKELSLQGNNLKEMPPNVFYGLNKLEKLDLSDNRIKRVNKHILNTLSELTEINLRGNKLLTIPSDTFSSTKKLRWIYLSKNSIIKIGDRAFGNLSVDMIDLRFNNLDKVPVMNLKQLRIKDKILLDGNQIECDCKLFHLLQTDMKCLFSNRKLRLGHCSSGVPISFENLYLLFRRQGCATNNVTVVCETNYLDLVGYGEEDTESNMTLSVSNGGQGMKTINKYGWIIIITLVSVVSFLIVLNLVLLTVKRQEYGKRPRKW